MKTYKDEDKKNYIDKDGLAEPILVLNRGYGKGSYILNYCSIKFKSNEFMMSSQN
jgi:hypothetical protein